MAEVVNVRMGLYVLEYMYECNLGYYDAYDIYGMEVNTCTKIVCLLCNSNHFTLSEYMKMYSTLGMIVVIMVI